MNERRSRFRKRVFPGLNLLLIVMLLLTGCGPDNGGMSPEYSGVQYSGEGSLETKVDMVIFNEEEVLFFQTVKIIDDHPTVWKALQAVSGNKDQGMLIEKDKRGQIVQVGDLKNTAQKRWELSIDNTYEGGNLADIEIGEEQPLTLRYTGGS